MIDHSKKRKKNLSLKTYEKAMRKHHGYVSSIAEELNVSHQAVYQRINHSKRLQDLQQEIEDKITDKAEQVLAKQINLENMTAVIFHLKTKGKHRGYSERVENELSTKDDKPLSIEWHIVKEAED